MILKKKIPERDKIPENAETYLAEFQKKRSRRKIIWRILFLAFLLAGLGFGLEWLFAWSGYFDLKEVRVEGNKQIKTEQILSFLGGKVGQRSWVARHLGPENYFSWPSELDEEDAKEFSSLKSIAIDKDFSEKKILVTVVEREPYGVWCLGEKEIDCSWFDEKGIILEHAPYVEGSLIPRISDYTRDKLEVNSVVLPDNFVGNLFSILSVLEEGKISIKEIRIEDANLQEIKVINYDGPDIFFSLRFSSENALPIIVSFKKGAIEGAGFGNLEYLDFRVENRVYYK